MSAGDLTGIMKASSSSNDWARILFDLLFYIIVGVLLFAMVSGLIVDTFSAISMSAMRRESTLANTCLICSMTRTEYVLQATAADKEPDFKKHQEVEHNWLNYVYFLTYLKLRNKLELNGPESYVWELHTHNNHSWIPRQMCYAFKVTEQGSLGDENGSVGAASLRQEMGQMQKDLQQEVAQLRLQLQQNNEALVQSNETILALLQANDARALGAR